MANALSFRRMAYTLGLMERMRYVVCESALLQDPLAVGSSKSEEGHKQQRDQYFLIHKPCLEVDRDRQKSCSKRAGGYDSDRSMRGGDAVNLFPFTLLVESHDA